MKKKIIVACGGAVATSTLAAKEIKDLCKEKGIDFELIQCRINEINTFIDGVDFICTTAKMDQHFGIYRLYMECHLFQEWEWMN